MKSKLSVLLSNYNYGHWLEECLEAICNQSWLPYEVIVIDDGSTDNSKDILRKLAKEYDFLKIILYDDNIGGISRAIELYSMATGDYIYFAASDDKVLPGFFKGTMEMFEKFPQAAVSCSSCLLYKYPFRDEDLKKCDIGIADSNEYFTPEEALVEYKAASFTPIWANTCIVNKKMMDEIGGFEEDLQWSMDSFSQTVLALRHGFIYVHVYGTMIRIHTSQYGARNAGDPDKERELLKRLMDKALTKPYADVLGKIQDSAPLTCRPYIALELAMSDNKYAGFVTPSLVKHAFPGRFL